MLEFLKKLFGFGPKTDYKALMKEGALIVDVRSPKEYASGHIKGSINLPLDNLSKNLNKLKDTNQAIVTCCASGMRSAMAKKVLNSKGYLNVFNGGGWESLQNKL